MRRDTSSSFARATYKKGDFEGFCWDLLRRDLPPVWRTVHNMETKSRLLGEYANQDIQCRCMVMFPSTAPVATVHAVNHDTQFCVGVSVVVRHVDCFMRVYDVNKPTVADVARGDHG